MNVIKTDIEDVLIIEPDVYKDDRGYFMESFDEAKFFKETGITVRFIKDNESMSGKGVLRGLHYQKPPYAQAKLLRVVEGTVFDVAVDIREGSPTYGKFVMVQLSGENKRQLYIPKGFAHGFIVTSEKALFQYKVDNFYMPGFEDGIAWDDPDIDILWPMDLDDIILSEKDKNRPTLKDVEKVFKYEPVKQA